MKNGVGMEANVDLVKGSVPSAGKGSKAAGKPSQFVGNFFAAHPAF